VSNQGKHLLEALSQKGGAAPTGAGGVSSGESGGFALRPSQWQWLLLAQVVLLLCAFLVGRASVQETSASEARTDASRVPPSAPAVTPNMPSPDTSGPSAPVSNSNTPAVAASTPSTTLPMRAEPTPVSAEEQALRDPRNVYTLKVADYVFNESSVRLAQDAARYLKNSGLPACLVQKGTRVYLLVGAAPKQVDLDELGRTVRVLNGPPPINRPREFHDAYVEKIDKVFQRK
jgi:hypothetical protein